MVKIDEEPATDHRNSEIKNISFRLELNSLNKWLLAI